MAYLFFDQICHVNQNTVTTYKIVLLFLAKIFYLQLLP